MQYTACSNPSHGGDSDALRTVQARLPPHPLAPREFFFSTAQASALEFSPHALLAPAFPPTLQQEEATRWLPVFATNYSRDA